MQKRVLIVLTASALLAGSAVNASLVSVEFVVSPHQHPDEDIYTYRIVARFTDPMDRIASVNSGAQNIKITLKRGVLFNQPQFEGDPINDFPSTSLGGEPWDTYVTIGATDFPHNVQFTPGFLSDSDVPPKESVIQGCNIEEDNGAWFFFGAPPTVGQFDSVPGNETYDVVIAQFNVVPHSDIRFRGSLQWFPASGGSNNTPFELGNLSPRFHLADLNGDWNVNTQDLLLLFAEWGKTNYDTGPAFCPTPPDFNDDGVVDIVDLEFLLDNWCTNCY